MDTGFAPYGMDMPYRVISYNNPIVLKDLDGHAATPFHMITDLPGATLGWMLGSGTNPLTVAQNHWSLDVSDLNDLSKDALQVHANAWLDPISGVRATRGEALDAAWGSFTSNIGNGNTVWEANHTFYDILTHWGSSWGGFNLNDSSTWAGGAAHFVFNDTALGILFSPVAVMESIGANVYSAASGWFSEDNSYISSFYDYSSGYNDATFYGGSYYNFNNSYNYSGGSSGGSYYDYNYDGGSSGGGYYDYDYDYEYEY
jgi:hypothetical protein